MRGLCLNLVLDSCQNSKLTLDCDIELVCVLDDLLGQCDVLVIRKG